MTPSDNPLLIAALDYAARGWPVFPCNPTTKAPLLKGDVDGAGKTIPRTGGVKKASTDAATITGWWERWPKALIGAATGVAFWVVDFDPREDVATGEVWTLERLKGEVEAQIGVALPATLASRTQSGGVHLFFALPDDGGPAVTNRGNLPQHVDVRGKGGYVIVPPSKMQSGASYHWLRGDGGAAIASAPAELLKVLRASGASHLTGEGDFGSTLASANGKQTGVGTSSPTELPRTGDGQGAADAVRKYALSAFDLECQALRSAGDGDRNSTLNRVAFSLGTLVGAGALDKAMVRAALVSIASAWPNLPKSEGTIDSGLNRGVDEPRDLRPIEREAEERAAKYAGSRARGAAKPQQSPARTAAPAQPAAADDVRASSPAPAPPREGQPDLGGLRRFAGNKGCGGCDSAAARLPLTDLGNAERWELRYGADFRYCAALGWLAWDGQRWSRDDADTLLSESIYATVRAIGDEAALIEREGAEWVAADPQRYEGSTGHPNPIMGWKGSGNDKYPVLLSDKLKAWGRSSEGARPISAIRTLALPMVAVKLTEFDADPMKLNVRNGTLVFGRVESIGFEGERVFEATVQLVPHCREDLMTMIAEVDYVPGATSPLYDRFLERVQPDAQVRRFLHAFAGYGLTGDVGEQKFVINHGATGQNGKGVWIDAVAHLMGDYAQTVPIEVFLDNGRTRNSGAPSPDLAELPRKRLLRTSEPPQGVPFAEALIKLATGGEPMRARHLNLPFFEFMPEFKIVVTMNPAPKLSDDAATWRRVVIVPWTVRIPMEDRDTELGRKMRAENSGILNRLIEGLVDWIENGLPEVDVIVAATKAQRDQSDPLGQFLEAATVAEADARVNSTRLFEVFRAWAMWAGQKEWTQKGFSTAMNNRGFEKIQSNTVHFIGLRLVRGVGDFVEVMPDGKWLAREGLKESEG